MERRILAAGFNCTGGDRTVELARMFLAVRQERYTTLTADDIHWERRNEFMEGMAQYIETWIWLALGERGYTPVLLINDPGFHRFAFAEDKRKLVTMIIRERGLPVDDENMASTRCYYYGLAQAFMLDQLCGNEWKTNFFDDGVYFETELKNRAGFEPEKRAHYVSRAIREFGF